MKQPTDKLVKCYSCNGRGAVPSAADWSYVTCEDCKGFGKILIDRTGREVELGINVR